MDNKGHIKVDEYQNTSASKIYALGDVCGRALLTPGMTRKISFQPFHTETYVRSDTLGNILTI